MTSPKTVSVAVIVFNHGKYLARTLEGIEAQNLERQIEIVIHDDASTDDSETVYRRFAETSRHKVKVIRQQQNIHSRQISLWPYIMAECTGDMVAICEGDDFWLSPDKLAVQCAGLDQLPHVDIAFHKVARVHYESEALMGFYSDYGDEPKLFGPSEVIEGDGGFMPTPSLVIRRSVLDTMPAFFFDKPPVGDYFLQVWGSVRGGALYMPMAGAAYREGDPTSWSQRVRYDLAAANRFELQFIEYLFHLRRSLPLQFSPNVDKIMMNHYMALCRNSFHFRTMDSLEEVAKLIRKNS